MSEPYPPRPTFATIDLDNLAFNFRSVKGFVGDNVRYMAVVKADAYGHGAIECARLLEREGADWFAVAILEEAIQLRDTGIKKPVLCLNGFWPGQEEAGMQFGVTPVVFDIAAAERISQIARARQESARVHVKVDTGMGRVGVPFTEVSEFAERLASIPNLEVQGVMTHFAAADNLAENEFTEKQIQQLNVAVSIFREKGLDPEIIDMANSPGAIAHPSSRGNLVRLGGVLYGLGGDVLPREVEKPELMPVMSLRTEIAQIKKVPPGTSLGYGRTFVTERESLIGTVPIGYHDGYRRNLSNRAQVIVNGSLPPVVGRISMDWTTIDLTDVIDVSVGDEVILIGQSNNLSIRAEDLAGLIGTISYEITCGISSRVPRRFIDTTTTHSNGSASV